jgi:hypothetical protein
MSQPSQFLAVRVMASMALLAQRVESLSAAASAWRRSSDALATARVTEETRSARRKNSIICCRVSRPLATTTSVDTWVTTSPTIRVRSAQAARLSGMKRFIASRRPA